MDETRRSLVVILLASPLQPAWAAASARKVVELHIASDGDKLAFIPEHLSCATGVDVRLHLRHLGEIIDDPHDWVLLKPGTETAFLEDADKQQDDRVVIPSADKNMVLAATPLCARGKTVIVNFTAPAPGDYPFVCSVAGHGESMHGILTVTAGPTAEKQERNSNAHS